MSDNARRDEEQAVQRRARILGLDYVDTSLVANKPLFKDIIGLDELMRLKIIPLSADEHHIVFGVTNTTSRQSMDELRQRFTDQQISFALISDTGFNDYLRLYNPPRQVVYQDVALSANEQSELFKSITATLNQVKAEDLLAYLVKQIFRLKGSDIHVECQKAAVRIRFRVDGVLHPIAELSHDKYRQLMSAIASAANVSTNAPAAQSGHINQTYQMADGESVNVNLRVETVPTVYGQDAVMRLFNFNAEYLQLDNLGLSPKERHALDEVITHPTGMVLIVGPTGSGKTTTMYSIINTLNTPERKIITLEDPVEYYLKGVVQIPINADKAEGGFVNQLKGVLRLNPDVVMIGEIRDQDTARTALQAALTGHLVLSTFHASSAAAALTRMLDAIGINPLFASAIHLVMAQRLVRRLDDESKQAYQPDDELKKYLSLVIDSLPPGVERPNIDSAMLYKGVPSASNPFGFSGQLALREQLAMTPAIQAILRLPANQVSTEMIEQKARAEGMLSMEQDGVLKALKGLTTIEEVYRVVS